MDSIILSHRTTSRVMIFEGGFHGTLWGQLLGFVFAVVTIVVNECDRGVEEK